ncbi:hypothetical protein MARPU_09385 [Marichromatium purpuratum 984]|uniref:Uncharacterized protein n=2 Tax=Marichromatium purpuratum TaxID=37487 RepID=W0E3Q5_MARPU|nr:hypothetical protein MARPU_09385 [Marichromatium purpuratum 984]
MRDTGLGCFPESELRDLPGLSLRPDDENWLILHRLRETAPPRPAPALAEWIDGDFDDPAQPPRFKPALVRDITIEEVSELCELDLLEHEDAHSLVEGGTDTKVTLRLEKLTEIKTALEAWRSGPWETWAHEERRVRKSIKLYNSLFKLHNMMHVGSTGAPPELVWGIGLARWSRDQTQIDMPLIEQLVDLEVQPGGALAIKPRQVRPSLTLRPFLEADIEGAPETQRDLQGRFSMVTDSADLEITPYDAVAWEGLLDAAATRLSSKARHITLEALRNGAELSPPGETLHIYSTWAIYGRPRSEDLREQDLERLRAGVEGKASDEALPASVRGFVAPKPEVAEDDGEDWGLTRTVLNAAAPRARFEPSAPSTTESTNLAASNAETKVYFFPLAYNDEQAQIIDRLENEDVVTVTGPPGTGKTHSIANIISHYMATGQRVLVTARTPEALAAVREKLPGDLANLVIASVSSDREGAKQLEEAIQRLSNDVVTLNARNTRAEIGRLEAEVVELDRSMRECDHRLAQIATQNLAPMIWDGTEHTAMEMAELIDALTDQYGWMTDRPTHEPPTTLDTTITALRQSLPRVGDDLVYLDAEPPSAEVLPSTVELLEAHRQEFKRRQRAHEDLSDVPQMARDNAAAELHAKAVYERLSAFDKAVATAPRWAQRAILAIVQARVAELPEPDPRATVAMSIDLLGTRNPGHLSGHDTARDQSQLIEAVTRASVGQKPLSTFSALFNRDLAKALADIRIDDDTPATPEDWRRVQDTLEIQTLRAEIDGRWSPQTAKGHLPPLPEDAVELMTVIHEADDQLEALSNAADQALGTAATLHRLFPYGLDVDHCLSTLTLKPILRALRGNIANDDHPSAVIERLEEIAAQGDQPIHTQIDALRRALGTPTTNEADILTARRDLTFELQRLAERQALLAEVGRHLEALREAGAPRWAEACIRAPRAVDRILPENWRRAWDWARMKAHVAHVTALGNGDTLREKKVRLRQRREHVFEQLIRERTLLGLKRRMTSSVQTALTTFTTANRRLGKGTGKNAVRWRKAIRKAALEAAPAAPVWVMPEHKVAEQLPATLADFDLVILDEASQSDITALSALARGKKLLIVGDEQQVSPSTVGTAQHKIDALRAEHLAYLPNRDVIDENTSIFDIAMQMYPKNHLMLREHFRCVEPIIQFSTRFYGGRLIPIRVPKPSERLDPPLVDVHIQGAERRGKLNEAEARFIVDEIATLARDPRHARRDIAVISLIGREQAELIERMLIEDRRIGTEVMERMRIVCGDSRTMQGQERGIVFLSMVATPETARAQSAQTYAQRFNVALSRARDRLYLVHSVTPQDLRPGDLKLDILEHFADPMPEGRALLGKGVLERCQSGFERAVCQRLLDASYRVRSQVKAGPFSIDLVVEGAEDRRLAIELDGDVWHGPEKWHEDMSRQAALERAGWTFWRVFGSQWLADQDYWWNDLVETMTRMDIEPIGAEAAEGRFTEFRVLDISTGKVTIDRDDETPPLQPSVMTTDRNDRADEIETAVP